MYGLFDFGYIDTGTGSLVIQSIIGIVAGVGVFGRRAIANIARKSRKIFFRQDSNNNK